MKYTFDLQQEINDFLEKQDFPYKKLSVDDDYLIESIYKLFIHDFIDSFWLNESIFLYYVGAHYHIKKKYNTAIEYLLKIDPEFEFSSNCLLGSCYENTKNYEKMIEYYSMCADYEGHVYEYIDVMNVIMKLITYYKTVQNFPIYIKYLSQLIEYEQEIKNTEVLQFLKCDLFDTDNDDPEENEFDPELFILIEKEFIRISCLYSKA